MKTIESHRDGATVQLTRDELGILNNAINEVCNALDIDFSTRMGATREEALDLLREIHQLLTTEER